MIHFFNLIPAFTDQYTIENPSKEEIMLQKLYEFYRIIILPWPRYTQAAQLAVKDKDLTTQKRGELIEGKIVYYMFNKTTLLSLLKVINDINIFL